MTTKKVKLSLYQEVFDVMKPKERCSIFKLEERLRKKGVKFSAFAIAEAVLQLIKEGKAEISNWRWCYERSKDIVIKEITRPQKPT